MSSNIVALDTRPKAEQDEFWEFWGEDAKEEYENPSCRYCRQKLHSNWRAYDWSACFACVANPNRDRRCGILKCHKPTFPVLGFYISTSTCTPMAFQMDYCVEHYHEFIPHQSNIHSHLYLEFQTLDERDAYQKNMEEYYSSIRERNQEYWKRSPEERKPSEEYWAPYPKNNRSTHVAFIGDIFPEMFKKIKLQSIYRPDTSWWIRVRK